MNTELIDIYDRKRRKIKDPVDRKTAFMKEGEYMMYVLAIIEDENGRILTTKRSGNKKWAGNAWEIPGGGAKSGESSLEACLREVYEETGLKLEEGFEHFSPMKDCFFPFPEGQISPVYSYVNEDPERGDNYFVDIYHFRGSFRKEDIKIDLSEASDFDIKDLSEIEKIDKEKNFLHYARLLEALSNSRF